MQIILEAWYGYANMGTVQPCYYMQIFRKKINVPGFRKWVVVNTFIRGQFSVVLFCNWIEMQKTRAGRSQGFYCTESSD